MTVFASCALLRQLVVDVSVPHLLVLVEKKKKSIKGKNMHTNLLRPLSLSAGFVFFCFSVFIFLLVASRQFPPGWKLNLLVPPPHFFHVQA